MNTNDEKVRRHQLSRLIGVERQVWIRIVEHVKVFPIANEDLERETDDKTSAVHFLRFELNQKMIQDAKRGTALYMGVDHDHYAHETGAVSKPVAESLIADLMLFN